MELTVTVCDAIAEVQPFASKYVRVYVPDVVTTIVCVVAPVLHVFPDVSLEVNVTEAPWQKVVGPFAVIVGVNGFELTETTIEATPEVHPFTSIYVKVYVPLAETVIDCVVAPVLQVFPDAALEVKVTEPP